AAGVGRIVTYGEARGVDWQIVNVESLPESSIATVEYDGQQYQLLLNVPGRHMVANAVGALAASHAAGVEPAVALRALAGFGAQPGRGARTRLGPPDRPLLLIDESYNANTASMTAALDV